MYRALPDGRTQEAAVHAPHDGPGLITVRLLNGMGRGKAPEPGTVPAAGDRVCLTLFEHEPARRARPAGRRRTPRGRTAARRSTATPAAGRPAADPSDTVTAEDFL